MSADPLWTYTLLRGMLRLFRISSRLYHDTYEDADLDTHSLRRSSRSSTEKKDPSGFNKPQAVPVEFHEQPWGCSADQELPRTVLTKMIYDYIKENSLQAEEDKRVINPDSTLRKLFHLKKDDTLEFKNFQTYMARLYKRNFDEESDVASSASESESDASSKKKTKAKVTTKGKKSKSASAAI